MKPLENDEDRRLTIRTFANGCYEGRIKISSFEPVKTYLNENLVSVLFEKLPKNGPKRQDSHGLFTIDTYSSYDAQLYFEWLITVVRGTERVSEESLAEAFNQTDKFILALRDGTKYPDNLALMKPYDWISRLEKFEEETYDDLKIQMRDFNDSLQFMENNINGYTKQLDEVAETLEEKTNALNLANEKQASELKKTFDNMIKNNEKHIADISEMLALITTWMEKYSPVMDKLQQDYKKLNPRKVKGT